MTKSSPSIAVVVIGRNEGKRLPVCFSSAKENVDHIVYVDSGSTDGSLTTARTAGAEVVELDRSRPFTAARARNTGVEVLCSNSWPDYIQFIDGDCELQPGWIETAVAFLEANPTAAVACGRRREVFPDASIYNRLCDREWDTPIGRARYCGGDAMIRLAALEQVGGFNSALIAGEEPELCVRLREEGWEIWRLNAEMTLHDAAMTKFGQWWRRMRRGGFAAAEGMVLHGAAPERHGIATVFRAMLWGLALPAVTLTLAIVISPLALMLFLAYPVQVTRLALRAGGRREDWEAVFFQTLSKFPEMMGIMDYWGRRMSRRPAELIEYK